MSGQCRLHSSGVVPCLCFHFLFCLQAILTFALVAVHVIYGHIMLCLSVMREFPPVAGH